MWGEHFDDHPQSEFLIPQLLAMIGYMIDDYLNKDPDTGQGADIKRWFFWLKNLPQQQAQQTGTRGDTEEDLNLGRQAQLEMLGIDDARRQYSTSEC